MGNRLPKAPNRPAPPPPNFPSLPPSSYFHPRGQPKKLPRQHQYRSDEQQLTISRVLLSTGNLLLSDDGMATLQSSGELASFFSRNSRAAREPEILACARALRSPSAPGDGPGGFRKVGASGYCFGGWACFRLASAEHHHHHHHDGGGGGGPLVDAISVGHPSLLTREDVEGVERATAVQVLAPEVDRAFDAGLKAHTFATLQARGVAFEYRHFPGVEHACLIRGDERKEGERDAMVRGKNAAVSWYREWLHGVKE